MGGAAHVFAIRPIMASRPQPSKKNPLPLEMTKKNSVTNTPDSNYFRTAMRDAQPSRVPSFYRVLNELVLFIRFQSSFGNSSH